MSKVNPRITDDDNGSITIAYKREVLREWSYQTDDDRRRRMMYAREYLEGWCDCRDRFVSALTTLTTAS